MVKINQLEIENVKKIKAVTLSPTESGLTVIGGRNGQGKTSVLDAIAWALGGDKFRPSEAQRAGSVVPPNLKITLSNGLVVERKGVNSALKVTDPEGNKAGQQLLNSFVEQFALNLPKFMEVSVREKADILLRIIGVGDQLYKLETEENQLYNQRHAIGQIADQKAKHAKEMPIYTGVPEEPVSAAELIKEQQAILARNGEKQRFREITDKLLDELSLIEKSIENHENVLRELRQKHSETMEKYVASQKSPKELELESTSEIEQSIANIEAVNIKVRANLERERAEIEAEGFKKQYDDLTSKISDVRQTKIDLLKGADLPLPGLSVEDGELTYNGYKWDNMSGAEQLKVSTAIVRKLNPECGFVLIDKLEQMDVDTLSEFGSWLSENGLQAIATRVSTGDECSVIIEDGYVLNDKPQRVWKEGEF